MAGAHGHKLVLVGPREPSFGDVAIGGLRDRVIANSRPEALALLGTDVLVADTAVETAVLPRPIGNRRIGFSRPVKGLFWHAVEPSVWIVGVHLDRRARELLAPPLPGVNKVHRFAFRLRFAVALSFLLTRARYLGSLHRFLDVSLKAILRSNVHLFARYSGSALRTLFSSAKRARFSGEFAYAANLASCF